MSLSVALATYNGDRYLSEQLESFLSQTTYPDEVVVCDDGSHDGTIDQLMHFDRVAPFPVHIHRNVKRLGPRGNFNRALGLCTGDVIALSDQDDLWLPHKLERVADTFAADASTLVVIHDLALVDENLSASGVTALERMRQLKVPLINHITGSATALRAEILPLLLPFPESVRIYDEWIHAVARGLNGRLVIDEVLSLYRRHGETDTEGVASSWRPVGLATAIRDSLSRPSDIEDGRRSDWLAELGRRTDSLAESFWDSTTDADARTVREFIIRQQNALTVREDALKTRWPSRWMRLYNAYRSGIYEQFAGPGSALRDFLRARRLSGHDR